MIEKNIEAAVINAIANLNISNLDIHGFWQDVSPGLVIGTESAQATAVLVAKASLLKYDTFSSPKATCTIDISMAVRLERSPTGADLAGTVDPVNELLRKWQLSLADLKSDIAPDGFAVHGARRDGGEGNYNHASRAWTVRFSLALRGVVVPLASATATPSN